NEMSHELNVARHVQIALLPEGNLDKNQVRIFARLYPMTEVSGDYFDIIQLEDNLYAALVLDVSGHGVPSALVTTMAKVAYINAAGPDKNTAMVSAQVNRSLQPTLVATGFYFTAFFALIDFNRMYFQYTNAGHNPALLLRENSDEVRLLDTDGF